MAITYTFFDIVGMVGDAVGTAAEAYKAPMACNLAVNHIWTAFPWRQSLGELPPFYIVPGEQTYGPPAVSVPADFLGLERAFHEIRTSSGGVPIVRDLRYIRDIATTDQQDYPKVIGYEGSTRSFKISPRPLTSFGAPWHLIGGKYKKVLTLTRKSNGATVSKVTGEYLDDIYLPFDDLYVHVMAEGVKWAYWVLNSDQRAGGVQVQNGVTSYYGQFGVFHAAIAKMALDEGIALGQPQAGPSASFYEPYMVWGW